MGLRQGLDVGRVFLVDPGGEEGLSLVDVAGPGGPVVHIHGDLHVLGILLHGGQLLDLLQAALVGLAGGHAPVDGDGAGVRHGAAAGGAVEDLGGGAGAPAQEAGVLEVARVVLRVQHLHQALDLLVLARVVLVQIPDVQQDLRHLVDGVVAPLGGGAVAADSVDVHPDLHAAPVAPVDAAVGGLGGDHELDLLPGVLGSLEILVDDGLPAHAVAVLLLDGAHDHDFVPGGDQSQVLHDPAAVGCGGHAALLVGAAPAVDDRVGLVALIGIGLPVGPVADAHGVHVGVDGDDLLALAQPADDVAQLVEFNLVVAQLFQLPGDASDDALLLAGLGGDGDHVPQKADHVLSVSFGSLPDSFKIHSEPPF